MEWNADAGCLAEYSLIAPVGMETRLTIVSIQHHVDALQRFGCVGAQHMPGAIGSYGRYQAPCNIRRLPLCRLVGLLPTHRPGLGTRCRTSPPPTLPTLLASGTAPP